MWVVVAPVELACEAPAAPLDPVDPVESVPSAPSTPSKKVEPAAADAEAAAELAPDAG